MVEYIDRLVRSLEVRKELENHFEDALSKVERELERTRKAEQLAAEFGDEAVLAVLIRRGKRRCRKEGTMNISGVIKNPRHRSLSWEAAGLAALLQRRWRRGASITGSLRKISGSLKMTGTSMEVLRTSTHWNGQGSGRPHRLSSPPTMIPQTST